MQIIVIPGMGCTPIEHSNWYAWFRDEMEKPRPSNSNLPPVKIHCQLYKFPDPHQCRESIWVPHVHHLIRKAAVATMSEDDHGKRREKATLVIDDSTKSNDKDDGLASVYAKTIVIGHSSGAACAMRLLEDCARRQTPVAACILVAAAYTDLDDETERASEYFGRPWDWSAMKDGCLQAKIILFHGTDDHVIPVHEARHIAEQLSAYDAMDYRERQGQSHFFRPFTELLQVVDEILESSRL